MTVASNVDVRDLGSVRRAAREAENVVLGDDWIVPDATAEKELQESRRRRGFLALKDSPLARKIITFNLLALIIMVAGVMYLNPSRDNLGYQRSQSLVSDVELMANLFEVQLPQDQIPNLAANEGQDAQETLVAISRRDGVEVLVFDADQTLVATTFDTPPPPEREVVGLDESVGNTFVTDTLSRIWNAISGLLSPQDMTSTPESLEDVAREDLDEALTGKTIVGAHDDPSGRTSYVATTPIMQGGQAIGVLAVVSAAGEIDALVRREREQLLQMFIVGMVVSVGLSLMLASTIANPIADLAAAAELGRDKNARKMSPRRVRIPDLTARPDEIGRLSGALRGMVSALYGRIEGNEQFAADVAHEIKNPLASLRSAVGTLRVVKRDDQRTKLLDVIDHDVRRLDRLVSDISNASRLDAELVKEEEESFDLVIMLNNLSEHLGREADSKGVEFITDLPSGSIDILGLEGRLAQVFVNLITNAISFCEDGDAIRLWARRRENRVLVVVEDTGPGIPDGALTKIFKRFYSERPATHFGNNSGLGLAISKQIVEAHGGVIWAENIRPTEADPTSEPLGARFVVGLPV
ncbi:sensor histidine kinase [Pelagovum pacificum]|uniref:histidine kinase n=1 Tax=Pelagovum pacificum TaxID=2588711 RepID=A0A5C5GBP8_9RHOB|nr:sensor histidine kinase [Pelagovum pacificum]QQA42305.1 sensor histidine kinase [Pelagovum pacificum]TNY31390.1 HAMP domain-containing protein [Pelagovum pacificum]